LMDYHWPGNVRELQNAIERALILSRGRPLTFDEPGITVSNPIKTVPPTNGAGVQDFNQAVTKIITQALEQTGGRIEGDKGAAKLLNLNPATLRTKMRKLGIPFRKKDRR